VVIPVFRGRGTLARAVASADRQSIPPREIIVVDNEPDSRLEEVLPPTKSPVQIVPEPQRGAAFARNAALKVAVGKFVAFLDCDDYWNDGFLSAIQSAVDLNPDGHLFAGSAIVLDGTSKRLVRPAMLSSHGLEKILLHNSISTSAAVVVGEQARAAGGFRQGLRLSAGCEDWALWLAMLQRGRAVSVPEATVTRLEHPMSPRALGSTSLYADMEDVLSQALSSSNTALWSIARAGIAMHRGTHLLRAGDSKAARREFLRAVRLHPVQTRVWLWLAVSLIPPGARRRIRRAMRPLLR
jgi:glycosyltransferase involved in cell wall biosynthesis